MVLVQKGENHGNGNPLKLHEFKKEMLETLEEEPGDALVQTLAMMVTTNAKSSG